MVNKTKNKKSKFKIYQFDFGTITEKEKRITIDIEQTQFTFESIREIMDLSTKSDPLFLEIQDIVTSETSLLFHFKKSEQLKNLTTIKNEEYPVKLSIAQQILEQNILEKYQDEDIFISLNPATIYYYPMETIRYTYSGNRLMPSNSYTAIEKYRALTVSILSNLSYEKCLINPVDVSKEANSFIQEIYEQRTVTELLALIKDSNNFMTYDYIKGRNQAERKTKRTYQFILGGVVALSLVGFSLFGAKVSKDATIISADYQEQLDKKDTLITANEKFFNEEYEEAITLYEAVDYGKEELAAMLIEEEQYQYALSANPESLEKVISTLYELEQTDTILELSDEPLDEKQASKLTDEKAIINGDTNAMLNTLNFLTDEDTASRLLDKYIENNDFDSAEKVIEKYPDSEEFALRLSAALDEDEAIASIELEIKTKKQELEEAVEAEDEEAQKNLQDEITALEENL
ncbi:MAG: hypothetical protein L0I93_01945 [Atopostipes suicloacalis]|nr:hypothetical protein [Atopostipes suicloacalis]